MLVFLIGLISSCSNNDSSNVSVEEIKVDLKDCVNLGVSNAAFNSFDFVKLETVDESLIPDVAKVLVDNDRVYVLSLLDPRVFIFSSSGKYINSIKIGQGPGEVISITDMDIYNSELYVLDLYRTIRKYDKNGNFIENVFKSEEPYFSFKYINNNLLLFDPYINKRSDYMLRVVNDVCDKTHLLKEETLKNANFVHYNFWTNGLISWPLCDTIYNAKALPEVVKPQFAISFKERNFYKIKKDEKYSNDDLCDMNQDNSLCRWIRDIYPYKITGLGFSFSYDKTYWVKYHERKSVIYSKLLEGLPEVTRASVGCSGNQIIYDFNMDELLENKATAMKYEDEQLRKLYNEIISDEENPVLVFVNIE